MIHFFPTFSKDARSSPFSRELISMGIPHQLFADEVKLRYQSRIWLLIFGWPKLAWFAAKSVVRSLIISRCYPNTVVLGSHIEVLVFACVRALLLRRKPDIVLLGFIFTNRRLPIVNYLRRIYFGLVFSIVHRVICHSTLEVARYGNIFKSSRTKFFYIPYGLHISGRETPVPQNQTTDRPYILTAGRSGRDYATLMAAVEPLAIDVHLVCDSANALVGLRIPPHVTILRNCYDDSYVHQLRNAMFVVIPLSVSDISAGQMVLIQAMAFGKPTIITRSSTVEEYVTDGEQSLLVTQGSVSEMRTAICRLISDNELVSHLAGKAVSTFEEKFCMRAYVRNLIGSLDSPTEPNSFAKS